jgi:hypothetical protein
MDLTLSGEMTAHVLTMAKKDNRLARRLAEQFLAAVDKQAMAAYLLSGDVALELLAQRLRTHPERVVHELAQLADGQPAARGRGRRAGEPTTRGRRGGRQRRRLGAGQAEQLRARVLAFLAKRPGSSRKQLTAAVEFPSLAIYNRIMGELKKAGEVKQKGGRSKSTYAVMGKGGAANKASTRLPKKARPAKKAKRVKKAAPKSSAGKKARPAKKAMPKKAKAVKKHAPRLCPVPGCQNVAAPVFGMMCKEHKDVPKAEQKKLFASRRAAAQSK